MNGREGVMRFSESPNPYEAPEAPITVTGTTPKRSRWRFIPATISGLMGGLMLYADATGIYALASMLQKSGWTHPHARLLIGVVGVGLSGVLLVTASVITLRGRWWPASIMMLTGLAIPLFLFQVLGSL